MKTNGRTPDEIKKGLEHCSEDGCKRCPYEEDCNMADGFSVLAYDALAYIQQLERERDAAVEDMSMAVKRGMRCTICAHAGSNEYDAPCMDCGVRKRGNWQWRGVQEVK